MLVITFSRTASQELRERVRSQLVAAERALADPAAVGPRRRAPAAPLRRRRRPSCTPRRRRIGDALADFDAATIATTHQFCQLVLRSLGVAGDSDAGTSWWTTSTSSSSRWSTTSTSRVRRDRRAAAVRPRHRAAARPGRRRRPAGRARAERRRAGHVGEGQRSTSPSRCAPRWTGASAASASSPTTTCSAGWPTRSSRPTPRPASGCASAGASCSSTSSRTPTRCSGTCSSAPSTATPRWC